MSHTVRIDGSELSFACEPGQSLLDAGLKAGIEMPYSCRKGVCGNCAGSVTAGEVRGIGGVSPVNPTCAPDQVLLCRCEPLGDVVLRPMSWHRINPADRKTFKVKVYRNSLAAPDVSILQLRLPPGQRAKFKAGQYLQIALDDGSVRSYSMANPPHESDMLTLHIRHVPDGRFSAALPALKQGDALKVELPLGTFSLADSDKPLVFVAGGTGFAPIKAILDDLAKRGDARAIKLYWGARRADGLYLPAAVEKWRKQLPGFRYVAALSEGPASAGAEANTDLATDAYQGPVHDALLSDGASLAGHELYCCGSPPMVQAVRDAAIGLGLAPGDFHSDVFVSGPR
ncbi:MAG TPA: FAD-binding oxidoreductase [Burkholderiaceae bacterium]|jgi:CDP-4-dehydro-6-deoxyglucose reductase/terephthalate 1,2-dioxygenase reductase component